MDEDEDYDEDFEAVESPTPPIIMADDQQPTLGAIKSPENTPLMPQMEPQTQENEVEIMPDPQATMPEVVVPVPASNEHASQPAVQATYKVQYQPGQAPINTQHQKTITQPKQDFSGVAPMYHESAKYIAGLADDPEAVGFRIHVIRRRPAVYQGYRLRIGGVIEELEPMPIPDLRAAIVDIHGGGEYTIRAITPHGAIAKQMTLHIDELTTAPKIPANAQPMATVSHGGEFGAPSVGGPPMMGPGVGPAYARFDPELSSIRKQEQAYAAEDQLLKAKRRVDSTKRAIQQEEQAERDREERKSMQPQLQMQSQIDSVRNEVKQSMDSLKDLVMLMQNNKKDDGTTQLLVESMKASSEAAARSNENTMKVLATMIATMNQPKQNGHSEIVEAMKMSAASNQQVMQMAIQGSNKGSASYEKLVEALVHNKLAAPDNQMKTALDMMNQGRQQTLELMNLMQSTQSDPEEILDADSGFWGNVGNLVLHGMRRAVDGFASGGVSNVMSKLRGPSQYEAASYEAPAYQPPPAAALPQPPQPQPALITPQAPIQPHIAAQEQAKAQAEGIQYNSEFFEGVVAEGNPPAPVQEVPQTSAQPPQQQHQTVLTPVLNAQEAEEDLVAHVTEAMRMALDDFNVGRKVHDWSDYAIDKWHHSFKLQLAHASDDAARIQLIESKCDEAVFQQVRARLTTGAQDVVYFTNALHSLINDVASVAA